MVDQTLPELEGFRVRVDRLLKDAIAFWKTVVDWERGGFFGKVDLDGNPVVGANKHVVQQARHLWTFANILRFEDASGDIEDICHHQFEFVRERLYAPSSRRFLGVVSAEGDVVEEEVNHYFLAFGIFGLANYALAFPRSARGHRALELAKDVFFTMKRESFDDRHGFDETAFPFRWCKDAKEINTQMHLMEAITYLLQAARAYDDAGMELIEDVLETQLNLIWKKGIANCGPTHFCSRGYREDWSVVNDWEVDCGHDIEVVYLTMLAATALGREREGDLIERVVNLGTCTTRLAFDTVHGKWLYAANPRTRAVTERVSNIWTNFEALNGLSTLFELTGDGQFLYRFGEVLAWLETGQYNPDVGEWYYEVDDSGEPMEEDVYGNRCGLMTFSWKSSYHSLRSLMTRKAWIDDTLGVPRVSGSSGPSPP